MDTKTFVPIVHHCGARFELYLYETGTDTGGALVAAFASEFEADGAAKTCFDMIYPTLAEAVAAARGWLSECGAI